MRYSAGLLPYRIRPSGPEVFLVHMAGPIWGHKDDGAWSVAKGEYNPEIEDPVEVAAREFAEEVGSPPPQGEWRDLGEIHMSRARKYVRTFAVATDEHLRFVSSNLFKMEWPPHSGQFRQFPETDAAAWFDTAVARQKLLTGQRPIIDRLVALLAQ